MIYHLNGTLTEKYEDAIILDVNGIGYQIFVSETVYNSLPKLDEKLKIYTHHHIREDAQLLFGFLSLEDKNFFNILTSVSGVGSKVAMKILACETQSLINAIMEENLVTLTSVPGVGKKMAERIIVELKDKLPKIYEHIPESSSSTSTAPSTLHNDLLLALKTLGYSQDEIKKAISKAGPSLSEAQSLEDGIKTLLKYL